MFVKHVLFDFFEEFLFQSSIFFNEQVIFFFKFFDLFWLEQKLLLVVIRLINEEDLILCKIDTFFIGHDFFINAFVSLFSKHEIITHFLKYFSEWKKETVFYLVHVSRDEFGVILKLILDGSVHGMKLC